MIQQHREHFNRQFTEEKYQQLLQDVENTYNHKPPFRIAESPVFIDKQLKERLIEACEELSDTVVRPDFKELTKGAIEQDVPNEDEHTLFLQYDFAICQDEDGSMIPQLIEAQGFPSLYFFQDFIANKYKEHYDMPEGYSHLLQGLDSESYTELLRKAIVADCNPENVILLEIEPKKQVTYIDFLRCADLLGIKILCVSDLKQEGKDLYYWEGDRKVPVHRIFHRVIFDDLIQRDDLKREFYFTNEANVTWAGHPNWFFRISKYTMPFFDSKYVPKCEFLHELQTFPTDLEHYVLKPLYSYSGTGVIFNLTQADIDAIPMEKRSNYILQKKVKYEPIVQAPDGLIKMEIRMLMVWLPEMERPVIINNLVRLSRGEMIGVKYNKDKTWVGGSTGFFEL